MAHSLMGRLGPDKDCRVSAGAVAGMGVEMCAGAVGVEVAAAAGIEVAPAPALGGVAVTTCSNDPPNADGGFPLCEGIKLGGGIEV